MNKTELLNRISDQLCTAELDRVAIAPISKQYDLSVVDAYHIQLNTINRYLAEGKTISGKKIGLTSLAMQKLFNVNEPDYGHIFQENYYPLKSISSSSFIQPKIEAEIAFVLKEDLLGPNVTVTDVLQKTEYIVAALEIVDSRIQNWDISLVDTVADNASFGGYVLGEIQLDPNTLDLSKIEMNLFKNGELVNKGTGADVLGNPAFCVAWLANKMSEFNIPLKKGEVILSGALSAAVPCQKGDTFEAKFTDLGSISCSFL